MPTGQNGPTGQRKSTTGRLDPTDIVIMPSRDDRRAALLLVLLAVAGLLARLAMDTTVAPGAIGYRPAPVARPARDSVAARAGRLARPLERGERVDLDRASVEELARLPRIGSGLAARIVADRDANGPFGSLEGLGRVSGIGPKTLDLLAPHAAFSRPARDHPGAASLRPLAVNAATEAELMSLPGIGPVLARAIVEHRRRHGPFRSVDDLGRVDGIGPRTLARLRQRIRVP